MRLLVVLLAPIWLLNYVLRRFIYGDRSWTVQQSLDNAWTYLYHRAAEVNVKPNPHPVVDDAQVYMAYGRVADAKNILLSGLQENPNDERIRRALQELDLAGHVNGSSKQFPFGRDSISLAEIRQIGRDHRSDE